MWGIRILGEGPHLGPEKLAGEGPPLGLSPQFAVGLDAALPGGSLCLGGQRAETLKPRVTEHVLFT